MLFLASIWSNAATPDSANYANEAPIEADSMNRGSVQRPPSNDAQLVLPDPDQKSIGGRSSLSGGSVFGTIATSTSARSAVIFGQSKELTVFYRYSLFKQFIFSNLLLHKNCATKCVRRPNNCSNCAHSAARNNSNHRKSINAMNAILAFPTSWLMGGNSAVDAIRSLHLLGSSLLVRDSSVHW